MDIQIIHSDGDFYVVLKPRQGTIEFVYDGDVIRHSIVTNSGYLIYQHNRLDLLINEIERYLHNCNEIRHCVHYVGEYANGKPVVYGGGRGYHIWNINALFTEHGAMPRHEGNAENMIALTATEPYCDRFSNPCISVTEKKPEDASLFMLNQRALDELFKDE